VANWFQRKSSEGTSARLIEPPGRAAVAFAAELRFDQITKDYGATQALKGVSLTVEPGEIVCLLGPSGCGKTTLLRIASGIERPTSGRVLINDQEVAGPNKFVPPEKRNVGLMFQDFALFPHLTILDNVAFGLTALPRTEAIRQSMGLLARVGLQHYADEYPHILSGGEQQRVALARALAPRPAVILMDEPFSGLDVQLRDAMQDQTLELLRETRATALIVTHNREEAMKLGDRVAVMRAGRLIQVGKAEELYRNPADLFVARLFSEINEIAYTVEGDGIRTPIGVFRAGDLVEGEIGILCLRQRAIKLRPLGVGTGLFGRVLHVRFLGDIAHVEVGVQGFDEPLKVRVSEGVAPARGAEVNVVIDPASALVFPASPVDSPD
jgi:iron(III) transport system ATP-binding protein